MSKPFILITPGSDGGRIYQMDSYFAAIEKSGGIPVLCGMFPEDADIEALADRFDGFLFSGGEDVFPELFGERMLACCGVVVPERDRLEIQLFRAAKARNKPILGICRGVQLINVAAGGSLYQDINTQFVPKNGMLPLQHSQKTNSIHPLQRIKAEAGSRIAGFLGATEFMTNSHHHQAVKDPGEGFKAVAYSDDGLIEAIENPDMKFCVGVQWHPERLFDGHPEHRVIFREFVEAAKNGN